MSYPILAGAVMTLSALRAGAKVKVVLSGEPGSSVSTTGFVRDPSLALQTLVNYLGTGYSFGIHRLAETFSTDTAPPHPIHILILSDYDMFSMLEEKQGETQGWEVAAMAAKACAGGATYVLQLPGFDGPYGKQFEPQINRMKADGWNVHLVNSEEELIAFARAFSRQKYATG